MIERAGEVELGCTPDNQGKQVIPGAQRQRTAAASKTNGAGGRPGSSFLFQTVCEARKRGTRDRCSGTGSINVVRQIEAYKRSKYLSIVVCFFVFISSIPFERENKVTTYLPITLIYFSLRLHTFLLQNYSGSQATHANHALRSPQRPRHRRFETHSRGSGVQVDGEVLESSHHFFVKHGREGMRRR